MKVASKAAKSSLDFTPVNKLHPFGPRVMVEYDDMETKSPGGIVIPQSAIKKFHGQGYFARILAVGNGRAKKKKNIGERAPITWLKAGDRVVVPNLNFPIKIDGREVFIVDEDAVLGRIDG